MDSGPHLVHDSLGPDEWRPTRQSSWHLNRFSRCCASDECEPKQTHTDHTRCTIGSNRLHLCIRMMRPRNRKKSTTMHITGYCPIWVGEIKCTECKTVLRT